jgi:hypothetical protein
MFAQLTTAVLSLTLADSDHSVKVVTSAADPPVEAVTVYKAGAKPGTKPLLTVTKFGEPAKLPSGGPFDVYARPKGGLEVRVAEKLTVKPGTSHELKLAAVLGSVTVFGDNLPRAEKVVLTAPDDPGPGEKGHTPVQTAAEYRVELVVPEGVYTVWVVPANGARSLKAEDKVRVHAGRTTRVGG